MKNKKVFLFLIMFLSSFVIIPALYSQISPSGAQLKDNSPIQPKGSTSYSVQWLKNPTLSSPIEPTWYKTRNGDLSDVFARDGTGQANMTVIGKSGSAQFVAGPGTYTLWRPFNNPDFLLGPWGTDGYGPNPGNGTDSAGFWARHRWDETVGNQLGQTPSILWKRNVTMPVNMTDYEISSVYLSAIVNATVSQNIDCPGPPADAAGGIVGVVWDSVRFFVIISTLDYVTKFEIAYNRTRNLGLGTTGGAFSTMGNTALIKVPDNILKSYLTQLLTNDHYNFTITFGINIYCEDNLPQDTDSFEGPAGAPSLRIKSFNLTIGYTKKVNQYTTISWNQKGDQLPTIGGSQFLQVDGASLQFKYRSDRNWTADSANSELQILINNQTFPETIKLGKATRTFQDAKIGGFDVSSYIVEDTNISVGIQVYIADNFRLSRNFTISIDDAYLWVNYTITDIPPPQPPDVNIISNTSIPFINDWTHLTVTCQSGTSNVTQLWYQNPFSQSNITLGSNFAGIRTYHLYFMNQTAGSYLFKVWASSPEGTDYDDVTVVWVTPQSPIMTVIVNSSNPFTNQWTQFMVSCQSGSANVSRLWYRNPFDSTNYTLGTNFEGFQIHYLNFSTASPGAHEFRFWANSTLGNDAYQSLVIFWTSPVSPILSITANSTTPFTDQWANITATCRSGSASVDTFWYYNPLLGVNTTLAENFSGSRSFTVINRSLIAGVYEYKFWANSTLGAPSYQLLIMVWIAPQPIPPLLSVSANTTTPYTVQWANITINCQSISGNVDMLWYYNPLSNTTTILAENFAGSQTFNIVDISPITGPYEYRVWANSSLGSLASHFITIVWLPPQSPIISITANHTNPFTGQWVNITITGQSGSGDIDTLWYYNPLTGANTTLATNFAGSQTFNIINRSMIAGTYEYRFWANSSIGSPASQPINIIWIPPQSPILSVSANLTNPLRGEWTNITVICQSGSGNVDTLWYFNPLTDSTTVLAENFAGSRIFNIVNMSTLTGFYEYQFWANSSIGSPVSQTITIYWVGPQLPSITLNANITNPFITQWTQIIVLCQISAGTVEALWYSDPFDLQNHTIATSFAGNEFFYLNFTAATPGLRNFQFWANSSFGFDTKLIAIFWVTPQSPSINLIANTTGPYINHGIQINVTCTPGTGIVEELWYLDPFSLENKTLGTNIVDSELFIRTFTSPIQGLFVFRFWARPSLGAEAYQTISVFWTTPLPPLIDVQPSSVAPFTNDIIFLQITVQSVMGNVSLVWYINPLNGQTYIIDSNFLGVRTYTLNFTSTIPGVFIFRVWANSTLGAEKSNNITIEWVAPPPSPPIGIIIGVAAGVIGAISAAVASYMLYFKVPKSVRMLRQLKGNILKGKPSKPFDLPKREGIADNTFNRIMKEKKLPTKKLEAPSELRRYKGKPEKL